MGPRQPLRRGGTRRGRIGAETDFPRRPGQAGPPSDRVGCCSLHARRARLAASCAPGGGDQLSDIVGGEGPIALSTCIDGGECAGSAIARSARTGDRQPGAARRVAGVPIHLPSDPGMSEDLNWPMSPRAKRRPRSRYDTVVGRDRHRLRAQRPVEDPSDSYRPEGRAECMLDWRLKAFRLCRRWRIPTGPSSATRRSIQDAY